MFGPLSVIILAVCLAQYSVGLTSAYTIPPDLKHVVDECYVSSIQTLTCHYIPAVIPENITKVIIWNHKVAIPIYAFKGSNWANIKPLYFTGSNFADIQDYLFASLVNVEELLLNSPDVRRFSQHSLIGLNRVRKLTVLEMSELDFSTLENAFLEPETLPYLTSFTFNPGVHLHSPKCFESSNFTREFLQKPVQLLNLSNTVLLESMSTCIKIVLKLEVLNISGATVSLSMTTLNHTQVTSSSTLSNIYQNIENIVAHIIGVQRYSSQPLLQTLDISDIKILDRLTGSRNGLVTPGALLAKSENHDYFRPARISFHPVRNGSSQDRHIMEINTLLSIVIKIVNVHYNNVQHVDFFIKNGVYDFRTYDVFLERLYYRKNHLVLINCSVLLPESNNVELIDLSENELIYISPMVCSSMIKLRYLYLAHNRLYKMMESHPDMGVTLKSLKNIEEIDLEDNNISYIPWQLFNKNIKLRLINLASNQLKTVTFDLSRLDLLEKLDLSRNAVNYIDGTFFDSLEAYVQNRISTDTGPLTIDITNNPIICECQSRRFIKWLVMVSNRYTNVVVIAPRCSYEGSLIEINGSAANKCWYLCHRMVIVSVSVTLSVVVVFILVVVVLLCRRLRTRKLLLKKKTSFISQFLSGELPQKYIVFLAYSSTDEDMAKYVVLSQFNEYLQGRFDSSGSFVCTDNDFIPGCSIMAETFRFVRLSFVFVAVVSRSFCRSHDCMAGVQEVCNQNKPIFLLFIEKVNEEDMSPYMKEIFRRNARAQFVKYENGHLEFVPNMDNICDSIIALAANRTHV